MPILAIHHLHTVVPTGKGRLDVRDVILGIGNNTPLLERILEAPREYAGNASPQAPRHSHIYGRHFDRIERSLDFWPSVPSAMCIHACVCVHVYVRRTKKTLGLEARRQLSSPGFVEMRFVSCQSLQRHGVRSILDGMTSWRDRLFQARRTAAVRIGTRMPFR